MRLFFVVWGLTGLFAWGKVVGHLDWSWWLVFVVPLTILGVSFIALIGLGVIALVENKK